MRKGAFYVLNVIWINPNANPHGLRFYNLDLRAELFDTLDYLRRRL